MVCVCRIKIFSCTFFVTFVKDSLCNYNQVCRLNIATCEMREFCGMSGNLIGKFYRNENENESRWKRK